MLYDVHLADRVGTLRDRLKVLCSRFGSTDRVANEATVHRSNLMAQVCSATKPTRLTTLLRFQKVPNQAIVFIPFWSIDR